MGRTRVLGFVVIFLLFSSCYVVVADETVECVDGENCQRSEEKSETPHIEVELFPNGGTDTLGLFVRVPKSAETSSLDPVRLVAHEVIGNGMQPGANITIFDDTGRPVLQTSSLSDGAKLFLLPLDPLVSSPPLAHGKALKEFFVWPGVAVGHRRKLFGVRGPSHEPLVMETLSVEPRIFVIENFLSDEEVDVVVRFAREKANLGRAQTVSVQNHHTTVNAARTSKHGWVSRRFVYGSESTNGTSMTTLASVMRRIDARVMQLTRQVDVEMQEPLQLVHYADPGQYYWAHHDYFEKGLGGGPAMDEPIIQGSNRMCTVFFYLNDVPEGGSTQFVHVGPNAYQQIKHSELKDCSRGLGVKPKKGRAAFWYNIKAGKTPLMAGVGDIMTRHGGCPPLGGHEKFGANKWVYNWAPSSKYV